MYSKWETYLNPTKNYHKAIALGSGFGILVNILLFVMKLSVGIWTVSISVISDAFNSLIDLITSTMVYLGNKIIQKPADADHPYGHGRVEYIVSFFAATLIAFIAYELLKSSVHKIIHPQETKFTILAGFLLLVSLCLKLVSYGFYRFLSKKYASLTLKLSYRDAFNDILLSTITLFALLFERYTKLKIDGYFGLLLSLYILYSAHQLIKETVDELIGKRSENKEILDFIQSFPEIKEVHDFCIHEYGMNKAFGVCDVVMEENDYQVIHHLIDHIEYQIQKRYRVTMTIHVDPYETLNQDLLALVHRVNPELKAHDFYIDDVKKKISFDLAASWNNQQVEQEKEMIIEQLLELYPHYSIVIQLDYEQ